MHKRTFKIRCGAIIGIVALAAAHLLLGGCLEIPRDSSEKNDLSVMRLAHVDFIGRTAYTAYLAGDTRSVQLGLMNTTEAELPADRGMIFDLGYDHLLSFWMRNTIIPLDIAYIRSDGTVVKTYTMTPFDESGYPSIEPARFAMEVRGGQFAQWGITEGDQVDISWKIPNGSSIKNDLSAMSTVDMKVRNRATYTAYVADNPQTRQIGLMNTTAEELSTDRGMIFAFKSDFVHGFWMRNTIIPLDIAYIDSDGTIVKTYTMAALDEQTDYSPGGPVRYVLELRAGQLQQNNISEGDQVEIPATLLNPPS